MSSKLTITLSPKRKIELTVEEAKKLKAELDAIFAEKKDKQEENHEIIRRLREIADRQRETVRERIVHVPAIPMHHEPAFPWWRQNEIICNAGPAIGAHHGVC